MATVSRTKAGKGGITFETFCALVPDWRKADLIDGVIYVASPENIDANDLFLWFAEVMVGFVRKRKLGRVFGSRVAFRLNDHNGPEPDLAFVSAANAPRIHRGYVEGPPDLAVEIVSPESVERDYEKKFLQYQRAKVPEYWIIDEEERTTRVFVLGPRRNYRERRPRKGTLHSQVLVGFWLNLAWLWQNPRPEPPDVLQQLLGS